MSTIRYYPSFLRYWSLICKTIHFCQTTLYRSLCLKIPGSIMREYTGTYWQKLHMRRPCSMLEDRGCPGPRLRAHPLAFPVVLELRLYLKIIEITQCCWWFRNPANQLIHIYPIMYTGFLHILSVVWPWDFWTINDGTCFLAEINHFSKF